MADENINQNTNETPTAQPPQKSSETPAKASSTLSEEDYARLEKMLAGGRTAKEEKTLKSYYKEQGLSEQEVQAAIDAFKAERKKRTPDLGEISKERDTWKSKAMENAVKVEAFGLADKLGVDSSKMGYVLKLADLSEVIDGNEVSAEKLEASIAKVLEELPELKKKDAEEASGFKPKVGGDGKEDKPSAAAKKSVPAKSWNRFNY